MIDELMNTYDKYKFASNVNSYFEVCLLNMMAIEDNTVINVSRETSISEIEETVEEVIVVESKPKIEKKEIKGLDKEFVLSLLVLSAVVVFVSLLSIYIILLIVYLVITQLIIVY